MTIVILSKFKALLLSELDERNGLLPCAPARTVVYCV